MLHISAFAICLDGFGAWSDQSLEHPLGRGGEALHQWFFPTQTFPRMYGQGEGATGVHDGYVERSLQGIGAWIMGRRPASAGSH